MLHCSQHFDFRNSILFGQQALAEYSTMQAFAFSVPVPCRPRWVLSREPDSVLYVPSCPRRLGMPSRSVQMDISVSPPATNHSSVPSKQPVASTQTASLDRVVCKFGGSSLADASRLREVSRLVRAQLAASRKPPIVVLSAMGSSTNELLAAGKAALEQQTVDVTKMQQRLYEACRELQLSSEDLVDPLFTDLDQLLLGIKFIKELSPRTLDYLVSFGERLSVRIFAAHLRQNEGLLAKHVDAFDMGFVTNSRFTNADMLADTFQNIRSYVESSEQESIMVVTGFIAKDREGSITTLGRGGSDLTASTIGAAIGASEVQVWKDVDGILSTDPRIVPGAMPLPSIAFQEAAEMAFFGAKILHPDAIQPAMRANIPVRVKNSYNPTHPGTVILATREVQDKNPVTAISLKKNVDLVDICSTRMLGAYGYLAEVFKTFARHKVSVDAIATSEVSISMTLNEAEASASKREELIADLESIATVHFSTGKAIVSLVANVARSSEIVGRATMALHKEGIEVQMISQGASKFNISFVIEGKDARMAVQLLHAEFFEC